MKISICIPAYNKPKELRRLLDSIVQQTYKDFEIIISDDTPDADSIKQVIVGYPQLPIRYFHHDKPLGSPQNWNFAIDQARGEYIKLMHDDDWFTDDSALRIMTENIEKTGANIVWCKSQNYRNGKIISTNCTDNEQIRAVQKDPFCLFAGNFMSAPSAMIAKKNALRYDKHIKWFVDIEYYIHLLKGGQFAYIDQPLVGINNDKGRVTDECITNDNVIYSEYFYCWNKLRKEGIISLWKSLYWLYKFLRQYKPKSYSFVAHYSKEYTCLLLIVYPMYQAKLLFDLWRTRRTG